MSYGPSSNTCATRRVSFTGVIIYLFMLFEQMAYVDYCSGAAQLDAQGRALDDAHGVMDQVVSQRVFCHLLCTACAFQLAPNLNN